jgi:hypothetical protein
MKAKRKVNILEGATKKEGSHTNNGSYPRRLRRDEIEQNLRPLVMSVCDFRLCVGAYPTGTCANSARGADCLSLESECLEADG